MGIRVVAWLALLVVGIACGQSQPRPEPPQPALTADAAPAASAPDASRTTPLSESECTAFVAHVVELGMKQLRGEAAASGEPVPTEAQLTDIRTRLGAELMDGCLALDRTVYTCAMSADNAAAYAACD